MVDGRDSFIEEGVFEGGFFIFLPESHSQLSKDGLFILGDGSDVRMKSKYSWLFFGNIFYDFFLIVGVHSAKIDGFYGFIVLPVLKDVGVDKLLDKQIHFDPIDVVSQLPHVSDISDHISQGSKIDLIYFDFSEFLRHINVALVGLQVEPTLSNFF